MKTPEELQEDLTTIQFEIMEDTAKRDKLTDKIRVNIDKVLSLKEQIDELEEIKEITNSIL